MPVLLFVLFFSLFAYVILNIDYCVRKIEEFEKRIEELEVKPYQIKEK